MITAEGNRGALLTMQGLRVEGRADGAWRPIVHGIDLTLERGEVLGLVGESGAGKSTLGIAAMGATKAGCRFAGGAVWFDGIDLLTLGEAERRSLRGSRIAYVAQSAAAAFNPSHRLIDQTIETALDHRIAETAAATRFAVTLYRQMGLPHPEMIGFRYPHQVSGGQLQRVMTAMAMTCRPDLIIFDEPTTALDVTTQVEVLGAIRGMVQRFGTAALYITHDLAVVSQLADRIMVLRQGRVVEEAPTRTILATPREAYTRSLWSVRKLPPPDRAPAEPLLRTEALCASYGKQPALLDISVSVGRGRTLAVVGESGSGKTTLARVIAGLVPSRSGAIIFDGEPLISGLKGRDRRLLQRIQLIYQSADTALNSRHSIGTIIGRPLRLYQGMRGAALDRRVGELLEMIELGPDFADRSPRELSGGQKQRVSIARALAAEPDLIICDEITSALDQLVQEGILKLLMRLQAERDVSYMFITHDIATVRAIADDVAVMHRGRVVELGRRDDVLLHPKSDYTRRLLDAVPEMDPGWLDAMIERRPAGVEPL